MTSPRPVSIPCVALLGLVACTHQGPDPMPSPVDTTPVIRVVTETVTVRDHDLEQRVSRLELQLLDRDAQIEDLQARLDAASREVVRSMAKVQTLATRAEAASGMAEAQIVLQTLRRSARGQANPEVVRMQRMLDEALLEFNRQNYGGALYLANQAKAQGGVVRSRVSGDTSSSRPGEVPFAVPLSLRTVGRCKIREGPGTTFRVLSTLDAGVHLTGISYVDQWMRVVDDSARGGWVFYNLVQKRSDSAN